jgi:L-alanine-DL-glutamate epimerase-like enolase superfamily enzyme
MTTVVAMTPDLGDRSRIAAVVPDATFVGAAALLPRAAEGADVVVVDLARAGVLDVLEAVVALGGRVVGYGPHVEAELLAAATAAGVEAVPRSRFFRDMEPFITTKQS